MVKASLHSNPIAPRVVVNESDCLGMQSQSGGLCYACGDVIVLIVVGSTPFGELQHLQLLASTYRLPI
ncbi:hypothetical protein E5676_scaffold447G00900 [Cucumis melo var. makuwa]|uniref:Uncharacterized protein n=1 Tax=Cucumis melo var. makuwa TaxID=1194695 RepID=A0A5A7SKW0_CUCMM|nr:hypothetical protein E6C27_scaffold34G00160 [Cucumis melo var. makuwa]TYK09682.1 hypothetical protein E5676_scaffold447G00900 [Cucumis melo var. makuwa]